MNKSYYSHYKLLHHPEEIQQLKQGNRIVPVQILLSIINKCNHRCLHCSSSFYDILDKSELSYELLSKIVPEWKEMGIKVIQLSGGGDPTMHPRFADIFNLLADNGFRMGLITNGSRFNQNDININALDWIRFSIDAGSDSIYKKCHRTKDDFFDILKKGTKLKLASTDITLGYSFIVIPENYIDIRLAMATAEKWGFDYIRYTPDNSRLYSGLSSREINLLKEHVEAISVNNKIKVINQLSRGNNSDITKNFNVCYQQQFVCQLNANGTISPCCRLQRVIDTPDGINDKSFEDVWFINRELIKPKDCPVYCPYSNLNEMVEYWLLDDPPHVNYV